MRPSFAGVVLGTLFILAGCGSQELDRPLAEKLLRENKVFLALQTKVTLSKDADSIGQRLRWWRRLSDGFSAQALEEGLNKEFVIDASQRVRAEVPTPASLDIEVTGIIKSGETSSVAEFNWRYKDLSPKVAYIASEGGSGKAVFQRYDDGWRVTEYLEFTYSQKPYALSESQVRDLEAEVASVEAREKIARAREAEARIERIAIAGQLIIGTWDSRAGAGMTRIRFKENGSYEILYRIGAQNRVNSRGRWNINKNQLVMQQTEKEWANGQMHPTNDAPYSLTITDISRNTYSLEQPVVYAGGARGSQTWRAVRVE